MLCEEDIKRISFWKVCCRERYSILYISSFSKLIDKEIKVWGNAGTRFAMFLRRLTQRATTRIQHRRRRRSFRLVLLLFVL